MTATMSKAARLNMGPVFHEIFGLIARTWPVQAPLLAILVLPGFLLFVGSVVGVGVASAAHTTPIGWGAAAVVAALLWGAGYVAFYGASIHSTLAELNRRRASIGECLSACRARFLPLLGFFGLVAAAAGVIFAGLIVVIVALSVAARSPSQPDNAMAMGGAVAMIGVLGAIVLSWWAFSVWAAALPALVIEKVGVFAAFGRSAVLTRGNRWRVLRLLFFYSVIGGLLQIPGRIILAVVGAGMIGSAVSLITFLALALVYTLVGVTGVAVIYFELRRIREGIAPEALAAVFD